MQRPIVCDELSSHQLDGSLSQRIDGLRNNLLNLEALLAYDIDFPEEDHGPIARTRVADATVDVKAALDALLDTVPATELVRNGAIVVIAGRPNVGKSSLFNALVGESRAIVTALPGTTRDAIEATVQIGKWPIRIVDTAGLRATDDLVERLGIEVSERYLAGAHAIIVCDDNTEALLQTVQAMASISSAPLIPTLTKADQITESPQEATTRGGEVGSSDVLRVSAHTREGIEGLSNRLTAILEARYGAVPVERPALTRARQRIAVERARNELASFELHWSTGDLPTPIAAVHIRSAIGALDELIGAVNTEDVLARVFSTFCIGK